MKTHLRSSLRLLHLLVIVSLVLGLAPASATYSYDGDGKRVKATVGGATTAYVGNHYEWTSAHTVSYYYLNSQRIALRHSVSGTIYLLGDNLGSMTMSVDGSSQSTAQTRYYAFGDGRPVSQNPLPTSFRFTGQRLDQLDSSAGLYYYGARYYDPLTGKFIQADTIVPEPENPQSLNRYTYAGNNPARYIDPTGHWKCDENELLCRE